MHLRKNGPKSSFEPGEYQSRNQTSGSADAYNLFYVEKQYLADKSHTELFRVKKEEANESPASNILTSVKTQREMRYMKEDE